MLDFRTEAVETLRPNASTFLKLSGTLPPWIDIVAFSPVRWNDCFIRPRALMTRCAKNRRVYFFEPPLFDAADDAHLEIAPREGINVVIPHLREAEVNHDRTMEKLIGLLLSLGEIHQYLFWFFSPIPYSYACRFQPQCLIYDCINEPRNDNSEKDFISYEESRRDLIEAADVVFTRDLDLFLRASTTHNNIHLFVDAENPASGDWDALWQELHRLVSRTIITRIADYRM